MVTYDDLRREIARLEALLSTDRTAAVTGLRARLEAAALVRIGDTPGTPVLAATRRAATTGVDAEDARTAADLLARAEAVEIEIGSWASGAGEGIASRLAACELKLAQAWLLLAQPPDERRRAAVEALVADVAREPNGVGSRLEYPCGELLRALGERSR